MRSLIILILLTNGAVAQDLDSKITSIAMYHSLDPELFRAVLAVESGLKQSAYNAKTRDVGIGQINLRTAKAWGFNEYRLKTDVNYNLVASAKILSYFKAKYSHEKQWVCRYNVGTKRGAYKTKACVKYYLKVQKAMKRDFI